MTTQNKTNPDGEVVKVLLLKDKDGIEALRAETKAYLAGFFEDTANDYFDGGTVWEDERFLLVMEDGSVFEILDFKNKTAAKKAFKKAVAVLYYGSSDLVAWINEKRMTPEAKAAIGEFELIEREWHAAFPATIFIFKAEDGGFIAELKSLGALFDEINMTEKEVEEIIENAEKWNVEVHDDIIEIPATLSIYFSDPKAGGIWEFKALGGLWVGGNLSAEELQDWLNNLGDARFVEEVTELPEWVTWEEFKEAIAAMTAGFSISEPVEDVAMDEKDLEMVEMGKKKERKMVLEFKDIPEFEVAPKVTKEDKEKARMNGVPIHFVGLRYYTVEDFIAEAERLGVSRALPARILKQFNWGSKIYLAIHTKREDENGNKIPIATVFGYFTISGINLKASQRLHDAVLNDPRIQVVEHVSFDAPVQENRGCGEYAVASSTAVRVDLPTLIKVIEEHAKRFGEKFKIMATGKFHEVIPVKLVGVKFTQNITWEIVPDEAMEFLNAVLPKKPRKTTMKHVKNYKLRKDFNKAEFIEKWLEEKGLKEKEKGDE